MFTSDSWWLKDFKLHHHEHVQVACQRNLTIRSAPRRLEPAQPGEFNADKDSVEELEVFPYLEHVQNITDSQSQLQPPPLPQMDSYPGAGAALIEYIAEPWELDAPGCFDTNRQNNPYYPIATREE